MAAYPAAMLTALWLSGAAWSARPSASATRRRAATVSPAATARETDPERPALPGRAGGVPTSGFFERHCQLVPRLGVERINRQRRTKRSQSGCTACWVHVLRDQRPSQPCVNTCAIELEGAVARADLSSEQAVGWNSTHREAPPIRLV